MRRVQKGKRCKECIKVCNECKRRKYAKSAKKVAIGAKEVKIGCRQYNKEKFAKLERFEKTIFLKWAEGQTTQLMRSELVALGSALVHSAPVQLFSRFSPEIIR